MEENLICQSCAMPLLNEDSCGSNSDGNKSEEYCQYCYEAGRFKDEGISMEEKIDKLVKMGVEKMGASEENAREIAEKVIPNLKRWKNS